MNSLFSIATPIDPIRKEGVSGSAISSPLTTRLSTASSSISMPAAASIRKPCSANSATCVFSHGKE